MSFTLWLLFFVTLTLLLYNLSYRTTLNVVSLSIIMLHDITLLMYIICPSVLCHHICCVWVQANDDVMMMMSCHHVKPTLYLQLPMIRRVQDRTCIAKLELCYLNKLVNTHYHLSYCTLICPRSPSWTSGHAMTSPKYGSTCFFNTFISSKLSIFFQMSSLVISPWNDSAALQYQRSKTRKLLSPFTWTFPLFHLAPVLSLSDHLHWFCFPVQVRDRCLLPPHLCKQPTPHSLQPNLHK